jgi:hypothetical protein
MIRAYANLPAYDDVRFDASPWFEEASPSAIIALVREEWTGKPAREMTNFLGKIDGYSRLEDLLNYKRKHRNDISGHKLELEIHVDPADALAWLSGNRSEIRATIEHEYGDEAMKCARDSVYWAEARYPGDIGYLRRPEPALAPR